MREVILFFALLCALGVRSEFCQPSDAKCWPTPALWKSLNDSVDGRLVAPRPPQQECFAPGANTSAPACLGKNLQDSQYLAGVVGAMQWSNWECGRNPQDCCHKADRPCRQGAVPVYAVRVGSAEHVQEAVKFANRHNVRLVVKSTGHDFQGRSTAAGALLVWLHEFKGVRFHSYAEDSTCSAPKPPAPYTDPTSETAAVTVVGGTVWKEVYVESDARGVAVSGGYSLSVSVAGGYMQGGGHSVLSPAYGLAVDNLLSAQVVTADGRLRNVSACGADSELFWALRGGGGGTFGVVTSVTYATHPMPNDMFAVIININSTTESGRQSLLEASLDWLETVDQRWNGQWSGYVQYSLKRTKNFFGILMMFRGTATERDEALKILKDFAATSEQYQYVGFERYGINKKVSSFLQWRPPFPEQMTGMGHAASSRFVPRAEFRKKAKRRAVADAVMVAINKEAEANLIFVGGGMMAGLDAESRWTSVTPAFRKAIFLQWVTFEWNVATASASQQERGFRTVASSINILRRAFPDSGTYWNEADYYEPDWANSFWGSKNFAKLKRIKQEVDPKRLFQCWNCVGGTRLEPTAGMFKF